MLTCHNLTNTLTAFKSSFKGSNNGMAKLTEKDVIKIRASKKSTKELMKQYNVSQMTILNIRNGKSWRHVKKGGDMAYDLRR